MCNSEEMTSVHFIPPTARNDDLPSGSCHSTSSTKHKRTNDKQFTRSSARQFLDLTLEVPRQHQDPRRLLQKLISWRISNKLSSRTVATDDMTCDTFSAGSVDIEDQFEPEDLGGWERSDALFIEEVHSISKELQQILVQRGMKSPFLNVNELFPRFQRIHRLVQGDISQKLAHTCEHSISEDSLTVTKLQDSPEEKGGVNDFLYQNQTIFSEEDGQVLPKINLLLKPAVLGTGLDKALPTETKTIMEELRSPLRNWRKEAATMPRFKEGNISID